VRVVDVRERSGCGLVGRLSALMRRSEWLVGCCSGQARALEWSEPAFWGVVQHTDATSGRPGRKSCGRRRAAGGGGREIGVAPVAGSAHLRRAFSTVRPSEEECMLVGRQADLYHVWLDHANGSNVLARCTLR